MIQMAFFLSDDDERAQNYWHFVISLLTLAKSFHFSLGGDFFRTQHWLWTCLKKCNNLSGVTTSDIDSYFYLKLLIEFFVK